ncbi:MAG: type II secretion system GspH family protein [Ruminococcus sp.]|nr:type II secretion system GspH family protein [Ruminococcus sp.]
MNKKKNLKGFTLIELIIVLAIFSVIMTLVMSFIDPVSRLMTKTSLRERTSAYVDNIDEYISKSIRYAQNINVYTNGYYINGLPSDKCDEKRIVTDFVDAYYDGGVAYDGTDVLKPLTGKVHILKLINEDDGALKAGHIYESVYTFKAGRSDRGNVDSTGASYLYNGVIYKGSEIAALEAGSDLEKAQAKDIKEGGNRCYVNDYHNSPADASGDAYYTSYKSPYAGYFYHSEVTLQSGDIDVINPENFEEYSYYYRLGMNTFEPISDFYDTESAKVFYSALKINDSVTPSMYNFPISIVTYRNLNSINKENKVEDYTYTKEDGLTTVDTKAFGSPSAMSSLGISFKNAQMQKNERTIKFYRKATKIEYGKKLDGSDDLTTIVSVDETDADGKIKIEPVTRNYVTEPFELIKDGYTGAKNNIYFVYTIPDEINDTEWKIIKDTTAPTT